MFLVSAAVICIVGSRIAVGDEPRKVGIRIEASKLKTQAFDPVFLRISFENKSETPIKATTEPTAANGLLKFEIRKKGDDSYRRIVSRTENLTSNALRGDPRVMFTPKDERTTFVVIVESQRIKVFDGPGDYELRAVLVDSNEIAGVSQPIEINVLESSPEFAQAIESASRILMREMNGGISIGANEKAIRQSAARLPDCELNRIGCILTDIIMIRDANTRDGFADARYRVEQHRKAIPPAMNDWVSLTLANMYREMKRLDLAEIEARRLPKSSFERETLERVIRQHRAENGKESVQ